MNSTKKENQRKTEKELHPLANEIVDPAEVAEDPRKRAVKTRNTNRRLLSLLFIPILLALPFFLPLAIALSIAAGGLLAIAVFLAPIWLAFETKEHQDRVVANHATGPDTT